ncbi:FAD-dependent monooxygenase [Massilia sp. W12]|uniref:FAD-dependent monooxygenase n=1 Tax=Massilia sp. W12 TaxID=3126507 RepID=UPI0030CD7228
MKQSAQSFDVAIAGGGPAGAVCALLLARAGWSVLLADQREGGAVRVGEGLPPAAKSLLQELGLWPAFCAGGHRESPGNFSIWGSDTPYAQDFVLGLAGCGYQLQRAAFDAMLLDAAQNQGAQIWRGARLQCQGQHNGRHTVCLRQPDGTESKLQADWLIDASGRSAVLARQLGAQRVAHDDLLAFYSECAGSPDDADARSMVEAVPDGWWYSVLLPSGRRLFAFFTGRAHPARQQLLSESAWRAALQATPYLGGIWRRYDYRVLRGPQGCDAGSACLNSIAGPNWLAAGDAAMSFDPLSSQGIAHAIDSAMHAARSMLAAANGDAQAIPAYAMRQARVYAAYLLHRQHFYRQETRWPEQAFWRQRHALPQGLAAALA